VKSLFLVKSEKFITHADRASVRNRIA